MMLKMTPSGIGRLRLRLMGLEVRGLRLEARLETRGITLLDSLSTFSLDPPTSNILSTLTSTSAFFRWCGLAGMSF
jgi:hypothetical protein